MASKKGISVPRLVLSWLLHYSPAIIALPGATRPESVRDSALAAEVQLSSDEVSALTASLPPTLPISDELLPYPPRRK